MNKNINKRQSVYIKTLNHMFLSHFDEDCRIIVTSVILSPDTRVLNCYFKILGPGDIKQIEKNIMLQQGRIRHYLAKTLNPRYLPAIKFHADNNTLINDSEFN